MKLFWLIITHFWTHLDEYVAIALLRRFGEPALPGISTAIVEYDDAGSSAPPCLQGNCMESGVAAVGIYGSCGPFDEHPDAKQLRKHQESACSLVWKWLKRELGISNSRIDALVEFVTNIDKNGGAKPGSIPDVVKLLNNLHPDDPKMVLEWAIRGINAWIDGESEKLEFGIETIAHFIPEGDARTSWLATGREAVEQSRVQFQAAIEEVRGGKQQWRAPRRYGDPLKCIALTSDNPLAARAILGFAKADVAVVRKPNGHTTILTAQKKSIDTTGLARVLNLEEQRAFGMVAITDFGELGQERTIPGGRWHHFPGGGMLLNGSLSAPSMPPSQLSLDQVIEAVTLAFDEKRFGTDGYACDGTSCSSTRDRQCPLYPYGLPRCQDVRQTTRYGKPTSDQRWAALAALKNG